MSDGFGYLHEGNGFATPEELGDTATPRGLHVPGATREGIPTLPHPLGTRAWRPPQVWQDTLACHVPYEPPSP